MEQERSDLHSGSAVDSLGMDKVFVFNCPYLGMLKDSHTSLAYPAPANHCFRVESPIGVDLSHQEEYCLTDRHHGCHVFQMASAAAADAKPVAPLAAPKKRKRRVTLYAFPLILILILLAAIIWWPAPGTTIQESLVLGAQNDREASGGATLNGKPVSQPAVAEKAVEVTSPDAVGEPAATVSLNESGDQTEQEGADTSANESARNSAAHNGQIQASAGTGMAAAPDQQAGAAKSVESNTETAIAPAQSTEVEAPDETQISSEETSSSEESPSSSTEETVSDDASEEIGPETVNEEASAAIDEVTHDSPAVVTADLPVISSEPTGAQPIPAITSYPVIRSAFVDTGALNVRSGPGVEYEAITVINSGELVGLIGRRALGPWVRVRLDSGLEGWVNSLLLTQVS